LVGSSEAKKVPGLVSFFPGFFRRFFFFTPLTKGHLKNNERPRTSAEPIQKAKSTHPPPFSFFSPKTCFFPGRERAAERLGYERSDLQEMESTVVTKP
jgi:hypothetical protein